LNSESAAEPKSERWTTSGLMMGIFAADSIGVFTEMEKRLQKTVGDHPERRLFSRTLFSCFLQYDEKIVVVGCIIWAPSCLNLFVFPNTTIHLK